MLRVVGTVGDNILSDELIVQFKLGESLLLLTEVPFVALYALFLTLNHVCELRILLLHIYEVLVHVEARLDRGSSVLPHFS